VRVRGVLEDGVRVQAQQRVREREREQQHEEQVPALVLGLVREPVRRHSLWLRWRGSKKSFSSIRQRSFSKLLRQRCANC
jgi:hypothetical protein